MEWSLIVIACEVASHVAESDSPTSAIDDDIRRRAVALRLSVNYSMRRAGMIESLSPNGKIGLHDVITCCNCQWPRRFGDTAHEFEESRRTLQDFLRDLPAKQDFIVGIGLFSHANGC